MSETRDSFRCSELLDCESKVHRKMGKKIKSYPVTLIDKSSTGFGIQYSGFELCDSELLTLEHKDSEYVCEIRHARKVNDTQWHAGLKIVDEFATEPQMKNVGNPGSVPYHRNNSLSPFLFVLLFLTTAASSALYYYQTKSQNRGKHVKKVQVKNVSRQK